jgi:putative oxidoreductase
MFRLFQTAVNQSNTHISLFILRLGIGVLMLTHGWPKAIRLFNSSEIAFPDPLGIGATNSLIMAAFAEIIGSLMIIIGLGTRIASILLIITMAVAVFLVHADDPFARKELGLLYLLAYVILLIMGSGKFSFDHLVMKRFRKKYR